MNDAQTMLGIILNGYLDDAGILADWLEENGHEKKGQLLRRRWRMWLKERKLAPTKFLLFLHHQKKENPEFGRLMARLGMPKVEIVLMHCDDSFEKYIRRKFRSWVPRKRATPAPAPSA